MNTMSEQKRTTLAKDKVFEIPCPNCKVNVKILSHSDFIDFTLMNIEENDCPLDIIFGCPECDFRFTFPQLYQAIFKEPFVCITHDGNKDCECLT